MSLHRILSFTVGVAALAAATAICLVSASYAIFALVAPHLGSAGGAAVVSGIFALVALIVGVAMGRKAKGKPALKSQPDESLMTRAILLAKQRPFVAAAVGALGAAVLIRNPAIISALLSAAIAGKAARPDR